MFFFILQMSDVELGGATAFPQLGVRIAPTKVSTIYSQGSCPYCSAG